MKGVMQLLAAAKLITLSEEDKPLTGQPSADEPVAENVLPDIALVVVPLEQQDVTEGNSFEEIYAHANLPSSPFPAERLLRLLDGLRAMDDATRKAAVIAMDNADDNWSIADPVMDAQRKIAVLESYQNTLNTQTADNEKKTAADIAEIKLAHERTVADVRKQISELEKLIEREVQKAAQQIANLETGLQTMKDATTREVRRMDAEIHRLREIPAQFARPATHQ